MQALENGSPPGAVPVHLVTPPPVFTDGITRYALSLSRALVAQGVDVTLLPLGAPPVPRPLVKLASRAGYNLTNFFRTFPVTLPASPHGRRGVLHLSAQPQATLLALRQTRCPAVVTVHDIIPLLFRDNPEICPPVGAADRLFERLWRRGLPRAAALIADSEHTRRDILAALPISPGKVHTVPIGIDHETFRPVAVGPGFYARHGLSEATPYVLYVGAEGPRKNLRRLVQAFRRVLARVPEARLLKVGPRPATPARAPLDELIEREGLGGKVLFAEKVGDEDLPGFYAVARVFAFPSLYEGFGLPPLEAMACGTAVVASDQSSMPEILGDAAMLVNPYDVEALASGIAQVLEDTGLRAALRERGLRRAAAYTWERAARETAMIYYRVTEP